MISQEQQKILCDIENSSTQVQDMVKNIVTDATKPLDEYIEKVKQIFLNSTNIIDGDLDRIILKIPVLIYYLISLQQSIDIRKGVSVESAKYSENEALLVATGTVAEKQAKASNQTIDNRVIQLAYKSASALLQSKINMAMEILASAKRIQQRKMEEMRLTRVAGDSVGSF